MNDKVLNWLASDDTGLSSRFIVSFMERNLPLAAVDGLFAHYPHDPADLGRCIRLMDIEPSYRARIMEMANLSPQWAALAAHWGELEALYYAEVPDHQGRAERTYCRMFELIYEKPHPQCVKEVDEEEAT